MSTPAKVLRYQAALIEKDCIECGRRFVQRRSLSGICSEECKATRRKRFRPQTVKRCAHCGAEFVACHLRVQYCSRRCAYDHRKRTKVRATNSKARSAQSLVAYHIKAGNIARPTVCEECGATDRKIEAAHHDYSRPLDVRWLCRSCHVKWDKAEPKGATYLVTGGTATRATDAMAAD